MSRITRRKFLGSTAAVPLGLGIAAETSAQGKPATGMATMIVTGANVYTMVWDNPKATAIAVRGNRLLAVGDDDSNICNRVIIPFALCSNNMLVDNVQNFMLQHRYPFNGG